MKKGKLKIKIKKLPDGTHRSCGEYDKAGRWYPDEKFVVPGSFDVRSPSRSWPYGYLKHFYTVKYSRLLFNFRPRDYLKFQGISPESEEGMLHIAQYAAQKMRGAR